MKKTITARELYKLILEYEDIYLLHEEKQFHVSHVETDYACEHPDVLISITGFPWPFSVDPNEYLTVELVLRTTPSDIKRITTTIAMSPPVVLEWRDIDGRPTLTKKEEEPS